MQLYPVDLDKFFLVSDSRIFYLFHEPKVSLLCGSLSGGLILIATLNLLAFSHSDFIHELVLCLPYLEYGSNIGWEDTPCLIITTRTTSIVY